MKLKGFATSGGASKGLSSGENPLKKNGEVEESPMDSQILEDKGRDRNASMTFQNPHISPDKQGNLTPYMKKENNSSANYNSNQNLLKAGSVMH